MCGGVGPAVLTVMCVELWVLLCLQLVCGVGPAKFAGGV